jgi:excisionase family DNA binding protein
MTQQTWLSSADLADVLGVSKYWVQSQVTARALPHHRVGRLVRFSPEDVRRIHALMQVEPSPRRR